LDSDVVRAEPTPTEKPAHEKYAFRLWTDSSGKFHVVARFRSYANGIVKIERQDNGTILEIPVGRLSAEDQRYIKRLMR